MHRDTKRSRLDKNLWFSTGRIAHAIQAAPAHKPVLASVSLTAGLSCNPSLENLRNFYQADPKRLTSHIAMFLSLFVESYLKEAEYFEMAFSFSNN